MLLGMVSELSFFPPLISLLMLVDIILFYFFGFVVYLISGRENVPSSSQLCFSSKSFIVILSVNFPGELQQGKFCQFLNFNCVKLFRILIGSVVNYELTRRELIFFHKLSIPEYGYFYIFSHLLYCLQISYLCFQGQLEYLFIVIVAVIFSAITPSNWLYRNKVNSKQKLQ